MQMQPIFQALIKKLYKIASVLQNVQTFFALNFSHPKHLNINVLSLCYIELRTIFFGS